MAKEQSNSRTVFITAWSGVGKTTTGDYLGTYGGFYHIDGDEDMWNTVHKAASAGLVKSYQDFWFKDKPAPVELWHPYLQLLCDKVSAAAQEHQDVAVSISIYRREVRDFVRAHLGADVRFLSLQCDVDVVVKAAIGRTEDWLGVKQEQTIQEWWAGPSQFPGVCFQELFGEYSYENFERMQLKFYLAGMEPFAEDEQDGLMTVDTCSRDASVWDRVNAVLGLEVASCDVDLQGLKDIQTARWKFVTARNLKEREEREQVATQE